MLSRIGALALVAFFYFAGLPLDSYAEGGKDDVVSVGTEETSKKKPASAGEAQRDAAPAGTRSDVKSGPTPEKPYELEQVTVYGKPEETFMAPASLREPTNKESYTEKGIDRFAGPGNINVFKVVEMSPSVNYTPADVLGTNESGFHDPIRIRGKKQTGPGGVKTYDGTPISGNPGGGKTIFDMENIESIDLYKGYLPVDKGLGFSNLIGKVDLNIRRPEHEFGAAVSQTVGNNSLYRTFLRLDTGDLGKVSAFGSFSETLSDKYKGMGDLERTNESLGLVFKPLDNLKAEVFITHNIDSHNNYYNLTYAETQNLSKFFYKDFDDNKSSVNYFNYNKQEFEDTAILANIVAELSSDSRLSCKSYYLNDNGSYWYASGTNVIRWDIDHEVFGTILKYEKSFSKELNAKVGYWEHRQQPPGPPSDQKRYTASADTLKFAGYAVLADNDTHEFHSPFAELSGQVGDFLYSAGIRYLNFKLAALRSYTASTNANTNQDHDDAIDNGQLDPWASVDAKTFNEWLPSIYLGYNINKDLTVYTDYSRTYGFDVNLFPTYVQQRAIFVSKGVTLQDLWDNLKLETANTVDLGVKYKLGDIYINPNAFVSIVENKQARIYDPSFKVSYPCNGTDALAYGAELAISGSITQNLDFLIAASYNKFFFTEDIEAASNQIISSNGKQVPDAPVYMFKSALAYKWNDFTVSPSLVYMSKRYGDVLNKERIDDVALVDLDLSYLLKNVSIAKAIEFNLGIRNLFNTKYISVINTADDALAATTTAATYQTGAPFGIFGNVTFQF